MAVGRAVFRFLLDDRIRGVRRDDEQAGVGERRGGGGGGGSVPGRLLPGSAEIRGSADGKEEQTGSTERGGSAEEARRKPGGPAPPLPPSFRPFVPPCLPS